MKNLGALAAAMVATGIVMPARKERKFPRLKQCLSCGKGHTHNNSFCSAECCKEYGSDPLIEEENTKTQDKNMGIKP